MDGSKALLVPVLVRTVGGPTITGGLRPPASLIHLHPFDLINTLVNCPDHGPIVLETPQHGTVQLELPDCAVLELVQRDCERLLEDFPLMRRKCQTFSPESVESYVRLIVEMRSGLTLQGQLWVSGAGKAERRKTIPVLSGPEPYLVLHGARTIYFIRRREISQVRHRNVSDSDSDAIAARLAERRKKQAMSPPPEQEAVAVPETPLPSGVRILARGGRSTSRDKL